METESGKNSKGGQEGNSNASIVKTKEEAEKLIESFAAHMAQGFSKDCFEDCDYRTIEAVIERFDLQSDSIELAKRKGRRFWEMIGINGTMGKRDIKLADGKTMKLAAFNPISWKFNMANRYGWKERNDITSDDEKLNSPPTEVIFNNPNKKKDESDSGTKDV